jgi:hypothetical protein
MATFVLFPGAGSDPWYWHLVEPRLRAAGHDVVALELPVDDDEAGLDAYLAVALEGLPEDRSDLVLVAQSMGAFTAVSVAAQVPVELLVLVAPMVPAPGETPGDWWEATGQADAARRMALAEGRDPDGDVDEVETFLHDVPAPVVAESAHHVRPQSGRPFADVWPLDAWPAVATRMVIGTRDRLFPPELQRRLAGERLGLVPDELDSGHLPALSRPAELSALLLRYVDDAGIDRA